MLFALICNDKPNSVDLRMKVRPDHMAYLTSLGDQMKLAGPFLNEAGESIGTLIVYEAPDLAAAEALAANDPYTKAGLFASTQVRPWRWSLKNPEAK